MTPIEKHPKLVVQIRQYRLEDKEEVDALFAAGMRIYHDSFPEHIEVLERLLQESIDDDLSKVDEVYIKAGGNFWVATIEEHGRDKVVGMVALEAKPDQEGELRRMSVDSEYRRYGVGRLLVSHLETWAKANGFERVWLTTGEVMTQACKFYMSIGYEHTKTFEVSEPLQFKVMHFVKSLTIDGKVNDDELRKKPIKRLSMGASSSRENEGAALEFIDRVIAEHPVTIFSKSYCPYCHLAKDVMKQAGVPFHVVELDHKRDDPSGSDIQSALAAKTGRRTVPNVFLDKQSIGGGSDVEALFQSGKLTEMLRAAGVLS